MSLFLEPPVFAALKPGAADREVRATAFTFSGALSSVRNIKSASSLAHGASTCAFDLLTGLFIRAIHRMALIPANKKARFWRAVIWFGMIVYYAQ